MMKFDLKIDLRAMDDEGKKKKRKKKREIGEKKLASWFSGFSSLFSLSFHSPSLLLHYLVQVYFLSTFVVVNLLEGRIDGIIITSWR